MKQFRVEILCSHETYNGYDVRDANKIYIVMARSSDSACNKAIKLFNKEFKNTRMYSNGIHSCKEIK